jgi:ATP-binding cassette, subfamily C (CFTR/MRP), member 1
MKRLPGKKNKPYSLFIATARALWLPLSLPMIPQLFLVALNLVQPLLVNTAIDFAENKNEPAVFGYSLIGAFGLTYFGIAVRFTLPTVSFWNLILA